MKYASAQFRVVHCDADSPPDPLLKKLQELADLPDGWRFGEGLPPQPNALLAAREIYQEAAPFRLKADAFPGADGSLTLTFYAAERCVEVGISPDGNIDISVEDGYGFDFEEIKDISDASLLDVIREVSLLAQQSDV